MEGEKMKDLSEILAIIAMCYFVKYFINMQRYNDITYRHYSILCLVDSMLFLLAMVMFKSDLTNLEYSVACIYLIIGCVILMNICNFTLRQIRKNQNEYYATKLLEKVGIDTATFKKMSYDEQIHLLKSTPYIHEGKNGMLVEDDDDLMIFSCILNEDNKHDTTEKSCL